MSAAMKVVGRFLKNEGATLAEVAAGAEIIRGVAGVMGTGVLFPPGSAVGVDRSAARAEIWEHPEVFKEQARALATAAGHLAAAATAHDIATVRTRAAAVSGACAACHELFRQKLP
ncbi:MAG: cytochrome c [Rhodospirillaceae bacterium]